jgi:acetylornithine deacetylase/succinyl-diaminopimelate desuccinylase-like protein
MLDPLLAKLKELVNDPAVRFEVEPQSRPAPSSSLETDFYRSIVKTAGEEFPGAPVIPMMSTGATDSAVLRLREVQAYGLLPFPMARKMNSGCTGTMSGFQSSRFAKEWNSSIGS